MRSLLRQVEELAETNDAVEVEEIEVEVGPLSGVESLMLRSAFDRLKDGTQVCSKAMFTIKDVDLQVRCRDCEHEFALQEFRFVCMQCGSVSLKILRGDSLRLLNVRMAVDDFVPAER